MIGTSAVATRDSETPPVQTGLKWSPLPSPAANANVPRSTIAANFAIVTRFITLAAARTPT